MRRPLFIPLLLVLVSLPPGCVLLHAGEVIDGVIASVNRKPLLRSEWDEAVRFEAFMQKKPLSAIGEKERLAALQRMIDRQLLESQIPGDAVAQLSDTDLREQVSRLRTDLHVAGDDPAWYSLLNEYGLTQAILVQHLKAEVAVVNFIDARLRPTIHVQPEEIETYYGQKILPAIGQQAGSSTLKEMEPKIRELLVQQRMDELLDAWLHNLRQQSKIESLVPIPAITAAAPQGGSTGGK